MSVTRTIEVNDLSTAELAELFCEMDSHKQAEFFESINDLAAKWPGAGWCQQSCSIADSITPGARFVIEKLAEHVLGHDEIVEGAERLLHDIDDLMANSEGVAGLHKNGDIAPWSDLDHGGAYDPWLGQGIYHLRTVLAERAKGGA